MLVLYTCSVFGELPALYAWVSDNVHSATAASLASGPNIAFTGPRQIIGVWTYQDQPALRYQTGHSVNAASQFLAMRSHWVSGAIIGDGMLILLRVGRNGFPDLILMFYVPR
jgi:hypothetical protein